MKRRPLQTVAAMTGMAALTDNRFLGRLRERRWRRVLVLLVTGFWLLTVAAMTKPVRLEAGWAWTAAAALTVLTWIALTLATRNVSNSIDAFADERDRAVRDRAHRLAYWIIGAPIGALVGALFGYLAGAVEDGGVVTLSASDLWAFGPSSSRFSYCTPRSPRRSSGGPSPTRRRRSSTTRHWRTRSAPDPCTETENPCRDDWSRSIGCTSATPPFMR
jgi:hypothetical protein